jgi:hypothetical protein
MADNSDQYSSTASNGNGNRSGRKTNSRPHSRNETQRDSSTGNRKGPSAAGDRDSPPGPNNQRRSSVQRIGNSGGGRKANEPPPPQARRASDTGMSNLIFIRFPFLCLCLIAYDCIGPSLGSDNSLSGSMHAPKGRAQSGGQRKPSIDKNGGAKSTLNPNAGGFQPGALSAIVSRMSSYQFLP